MLTSREFIEQLFTDHPILSHAYDPVKAREYYLRTRKLKGRTKGSVKPATTKSSPASKAAAKKARAARLKAAAEKRVFELRVRLKKLEKALDRLTEEAQRKSGIEPAKSSTSTKSTGGAKDRKPLTSAQKRDAAKAAEKRRDKEGDNSLSGQEKSLQAKIERVRERIEDMKVEIVLAKQKTTGSNKETASNGRLTPTRERR